MIAELKTRADKAHAIREHLRSEHAASLASLENARGELSDILEAQVLIQTVAKETQEALRFHIQDLVQSALDTVFPATYSFLVEFELKRGRTEAHLHLDKDGEKMDPMNSTGGGVVDIIAFALRLAAWTLSRKDNVIILDEPFKFVSVNLRPLCAEILKGLSSRLNLQIIMVTHDGEMMEAADRIFTIDQKHRQSFIVNQTKED